jgi:hypothetical protein
MSVQLYQHVQSGMLSMFRDENTLSRMNDADVERELALITEAHDYDDMDDYDDLKVITDPYCTSYADYENIEKYYVSSSAFDGYKSMYKTICEVVFLTAKELKTKLIKDLCDELMTLKKAEFNRSSRLPTDMNNLICSYL